MKSVRKINQEMKKNSSKISKLTQQEINSKGKTTLENKQKTNIQQKTVNNELEKIKLEIIKSVLQITKEQSIPQEIEDDVDFIKPLDLEEIKKLVKQKRLEK